MAMNLDAVLRIAAKVVGLEDLGALQKGLVGAEKAAGEAKAAFGAVVNSASWQAAAAAAAGFGVAIGISARAAMDFESSMADVRKVIDGLESPQAFAEIEAEIIDLSRTIPIAINGIAQIYAAAGQSGIARSELKSFATTVAQVAVAFDMTAEQAGQSLAQIKVALGLSIPELTKLADAMNYISNNTGATEANLVEFMNRAGATGKIAGLSGQQTAAFGAAMIQTGIQAEVAATSFNNMIKALSKGPSMTERQVSALKRIGYAMADAKTIESQLTRVAETESRRRLDVARQQGDATVRVAEEQSRRRIEIAKAETAALSREISRRYRNQLQALQDNWDDESSAREEALQDNADAQIKAIQREQDAAIRAAQERAKLNGGDSGEVDQIRDAYDARIDAVRDAVDRQLTLERRSARDQQQVVRDRLQDQEDAERQGVERRQQALEEAEQRRLKVIKDAADKRVKELEAVEAAVVEGARAAAKKTGEELAAASAQGFSDRLQKDAVGTVTEVLGKIAALPKSQQVSVLSDLFGDEARGLTPLLANLGELERILGLAADEGGYAGSVLREFTVRSETTANQVQLLNNKLEALKIAVGKNALAGLAGAAGFLGNLADGAAKFAAANPGLTTALMVIGGIASALVIAAPGILATVTLIGKLSVALAGLKIGASIAGSLALLLPVVKAIGSAFFVLKILAAVAASGIIAALQGVIAWATATLLPALAAIFSGPAGWTVLAVAAVAAMAIAFREPIMGFLGWLWQNFSSAMTQLGQVVYAVLVQPWVNLWTNVLRGPVTAMWEWLKGAFTWGFQAVYAILWQTFVQPWINLWTLIREPVAAALAWIDGALTVAFSTLIELAYAWFVQPWVDLWNDAIRRPVTGTIQWLGGIWKGIADTFRRLVAEPIGRAWTAVVEALPRVMQAAANFVGRVWTGVVNGIKNAVRGMLQFIANAVNSVTGVVNNLIIGFNRLPGPDIPLIATVTVPRFAEGGVVNRKTLAYVGDGGEPEYIIPQSKMAAASQRFLSGQRGASVIPSSGSKTQGSATAPVINVTTGPVLEFNGERYVTVRDMERAMRQTADGVMGRLRTPAARIALGSR